MPSGTITSATYNVMPSDSIVDFDTTSNAITATLSSAVGMRGKTIRLIKSNAGNAGVNPVTVNPQSGQTIGGYASTKIFSTQDPVEIMSDGANWKYVSGATRSANFRVDANCTTGTCSITSQSGEFTVVTRNFAGAVRVQHGRWRFPTNSVLLDGTSGYRKPHRWRSFLRLQALLIFKCT